MMLRLTKFLLGLGVAVAVLLLGLNVYINLKPAPKPTLTRPLAALMPEAPLGWTSQNVDVANTPEMQAALNEILKFDDATDRLYQEGSTAVDVYAAYWKPGGASPAKVGAHTPATCWVNNGWAMPEHDQGVVLTLGGRALKPVERGEFDKDGQRLNVIYWHLVGGAPVVYDLVGWHDGLKGRLERMPAMWEDFAHFGLDQRREQILVRVSSNVPFAQLWTNPGFVAIMSGLSRDLGLYAPAKDAGAVAKN